MVTPMPEKAQIFCRAAYCLGRAIQKGEVREDKTIHFDCEFGHKFHSDSELKHFLPCTCGNEGKTSP
jgi:hypothetical protein